MNERVKQLLTGRFGGMNKLMNGYKDRRIDGWLGTEVDWLLDRWIDGQRDRSVYFLVCI